MKVSNYLKEKNCFLEIEAKTKEEAIKYLVEKLEANGDISGKEQFVKDILEREGLGSTGIGNNVAIPHARTSSVKEFVIAFGRSSEGIDFEALDGQKVNIVFLMGANPKQLNLYLRLLAELSKLLMNESFRQQLLSARSAKEVIDIVKNFEEGLK